jgi:hypothetical protein
MRRPDEAVVQALATSETGRTALRTEVARLVLEWRDVVASEAPLETHGAADPDLGERRRAAEGAQQRLAAAVRRLLADDPQLTRRLLLRMFEFG